MAVKTQGRRTRKKKCARTITSSTAIKKKTGTSEHSCRKEGDIDRCAPTAQEVHPTSAISQHVQHKCYVMRHTERKSVCIGGCIFPLPEVIDIKLGTLEWLENEMEATFLAVYGVFASKFRHFPHLSSKMKVNHAFKAKKEAFRERNPRKVKKGQFWAHLTLQILDRDENHYLMNIFQNILKVVWKSFESFWKYFEGFWMRLRHCALYIPHLSYGCRLC